MNIPKCLSNNYQPPTVVVYELSSDGVLCISKEYAVSTTMEDVDREIFEW